MKKTGVVCLILALILNLWAPVTVTASDVEESLKVYVSDGEGELGVGDGTISSPYQNIRTALKQIQSGQTLVLLGTVKFTHYDVEEDASPKPLFINKDITITGDTEEATLLTRTTIQLGADVTFKNMHLEMVTSGGRSTTIYAAGHTLVLDGVNTKLGTNSLQDDIRPYISGGAYKGTDGILGDHAVIKVIHPTDQTRLSAIYAGDYWKNSKMPVDIELDGKLVDTVIHTAGADGYGLEGDVSVKLGKKNNVTQFDTAGHTGKLSVTIQEDVYSDTIDLDGVDELVLEKGARVIIPKDSTFEAGNVTVEKNAVLDFRVMTGDPVVTGDFAGAAAQSGESCGAVLIGNEQTLRVAGIVSGLTRLNTNGAQSVARFVEGHVYVEAGKDSTGNFTIEGTQYTDFTLERQTTDEKIQWVVQKQAADDTAFQNFEWKGGSDTICQTGEEYYYPIEFVNKKGESYKPGILELLNDFEFTLKKSDGGEIDLEEDAFLDWDESTLGDDSSDLIRLTLILYKMDGKSGAESDTSFIRAEHREKYLCRSNADGNADCDANAGSNRDADEHANCDTNAGANRDTDEHADRDADCDTNRNANCYTDGNADRDANAGSNRDANCDTNCDTDGNADRDANCNADCDANAGSDCDADCNADCDANRNADSKTNGTSGRTIENSHTDLK